MKNPGVWIAAACVALGLAATMSAGADDDALPPEQQQGDIRYRSGGIGADESAAMKAARPQYALSLVFASTTEDGYPAYESNVHVSIRRPDGSELLETVTEGPFLLIELPPGRYRIVASARGEARTRDVKVVAGKHQEIGFQWKLAAPPGQPE